MIRASARRRLEALLARRRARPDRRRTVVLCYHSVSATRSVATRPDAFERHVEWLREHCDVVPFASILDRGPAGAGRPIVAITFDDGYADNHELALPTLVRFGVPAAFFVVTGLVDGDPTAAARLARAWGTKPEGVRGLSWSQVAEMSGVGMDVGAHTRTHPSLGRIAASQAREEIVGSKARLEDRLGRAVDAFAYPFGDARFDFTPATVRLVRDAGFRSAAAIQFRGVRPACDPYAIPRFPVLNDDVGLLAAKIDGRLDLLGLARERIPRWVTRKTSSGARRGLVAV